MNKKLFFDSLVLLALPTLAVIALLLGLSLVTELLQESGSLLMPAVYYISRALSYALYFMWCAYICVMLLHKKVLFSLLLLLFFFSLNLIRIFLSFVLSYGTFEDSAYLLPSSAIGALSECGTVLLLCLVSFAVFFAFCLSKAVKRKQNVTFSQNENFTSVVSLASSATLFLFELVREIAYTVSFVSAQFGVIYNTEIWSIIFDYVFLLLVFLMGYFVSSLYIRLGERSL